MSNSSDSKNMHIQELNITNGKNTIYGKLFLPSAEGKYPVIILSHGYNGSHQDFVNDCKYYAKNGIAAFVYDFCGGSINSKSSGKTTDMTIFTEKSDLLAVYDYISSMNQIDSQQVFLLGGSQGGLVTALTASELSSKIKGVLLYFPALCIPDDWRKNFPSIDDIPNEYDVWGMNLGRNFFVSIHDFDVFENIKNYDGDVLIIHGDKDAVVSKEASKHAKEVYANAELVVLEGEGHGFSPAGSLIAREHVCNFIKKHII